MEQLKGELTTMEKLVLVEPYPQFESSILVQWELVRLSIPSANHSCIAANLRLHKQISSLQSLPYDSCWEGEEIAGERKKYIRVGVKKGWKKVNL